jgi:hypothetical protein
MVVTWVVKRVASGALIASLIATDRLARWLADYCSPSGVGGAATRG